MSDKTKAPAKYVEEIKENFSLVIITLVVAVFLISSAFNQGYFYFTNTSFVSFLSLRDYFEGTLPIVSVMLPFLYLYSYWQHIHSDSAKDYTGIKNFYFKVRATYKRTKNIWMKPVRFITLLLAAFLGAICAILLYTAHLMQLVFVIPTFLFNLEYKLAGYYYPLALCYIIPMTSICLEIAASLALKEYQRICTFIKFLILILAFSFSLGMHTFWAAITDKENLTALTDNQDNVMATIFLRASDRGVFHFDIDKKELYFTANESIKNVHSLNNIR